MLAIAGKTAGPNVQEPTTYNKSIFFKNLFFFFKSQNNLVQNLI